MTSKNSVDTIIYEILKEIPDRDTVSDKTSGVARVVNESPCSASSKSELRSNVQVCIASR